MLLNNLSLTFQQRDPESSTDSDRETEIEDNASYVGAASVHASEGRVFAPHGLQHVLRLVPRICTMKYLELILSLQNIWFVVIIFVILFFSCFCFCTAFSHCVYPEWPHRQCVGLAFRRSRVRASLVAACLAIGAPHLYCEIRGVKGYYPL